MRSVKETLKEFLFPPRCAVCGSLLPLEKEERLLCPDCLAHPPFLTGEKCRICGRPVDNDVLCHRCRHKDFLFTAGTAAFSYETMQEEIAAFKFHGAVIFGKTNLDELAAHVSGRTSCFGPTVNPWHPERRLSPGGSSSGTAAAVAAGYCPGGLGTDTGGSIRLPAGWCGLYGIRSTQGQSDISGIYPRAASLDTVGAMARSARDIDLLLQILADPPLRDTLRASAPIRYLRIGVFPELVRAKGSPEVIEAYAEAVGRWEEFGECIPVGLPLLDDPAVVDSVSKHKV